MSVDYRVTIDGIEQLSNKLVEVGKGEWLKDGLEVVGIDLSSKAKVYPPKPPNSKYQRTGQLRQHWTYQVNATGDALMVGNNMPYAPYVQGRETQAKVHQWHGWQTIEGILQLNLDRVSQFLKTYLERGLNG